MLFANFSNIRYAKKNQNRLLKNIITVSFLLLPVIFIQSASAEDIIAHWNFNTDTPGIVKDVSRNNRHGAVSKSAKYFPGVDGKAIFFDGKTVVDCGMTNLVFDGDFSVEAWVYTEKNDPQTIAAKWQGHGTQSAWWIGIYQKVFQFRCTVEGVGSQVLRDTLERKGWNYVVGVRKGSLLTLSVNGEKVHERKIESVPFGLNAGNITIGAIQDINLQKSWLWKGFIDEIIISAFSIDEKDIQQNFTLKKEDIPSDTDKVFKTLIPFSYGISTELPALNNEISDKMLLMQIKPNIPALKSFYEEMKNENIEKAKMILAGYYRERKSPVIPKSDIFTWRGDSTMIVSMRDTNVNSDYNRKLLNRIYILDNNTTGTKEEFDM